MNHSGLFCIYSGERDKMGPRVIFSRRLLNRRTNSILKSYAKTSKPDLSEVKRIFECFARVCCEFFGANLQNRKYHGPGFCSI